MKKGHFRFNCRTVKQREVQFLELLLLFANNLSVDIFFMKFHLQERLFFTVDAMCSVSCDKKPLLSASLKPLVSKEQEENTFKIH